MHPSRCCHFETKFSDYDTFRTPKVQLLPICSSVLLNLFSSHCDPRVFGSLERKSRGNNSRTSTLSWLYMDINLFLFFGTFATYCSSLLGLRCNIFFVIYFLFPADIFAYIPLTNKYLLHVFRFSTNLPKKALKKPVKSAKKWNESKRPKNTVGETLSRSFRVKMNFSPPCCNKDWHAVHKEGYLLR